MTWAGTRDTAAVGAEVLAQLGWQDKSFLDESVEALLRLLDDPHDPAALSHNAPVAGRVRHFNCKN